MTFGGFAGSAGGSATLTVTNSTLSGNSADVSGGGIYNDAGTLNLNSSIVAHSTGGDGERTAGTVNAQYSLIKNSSPGFVNGTNTGNVIGTDPMLGPLQDNGGPTFTHALLTGSPAIDMGDPSFTPPPDFDQRGTGFPRVVNNRIDIGAFEVQTLPTCPQPKGYWKNNPNLWPASALPMKLGNPTYSKTELVNILKMAVGTGPKADTSLILADQLIAAKLNIANGSDPTPIESTIMHADSLFSAFGGNKLPYKVRTNSPNGKMMVSDANTLNSYITVC